MPARLQIRIELLGTLALLSVASTSYAQLANCVILPEQRTVAVRDPAHFSRLASPADNTAPPTVENWNDDASEQALRLDDAIQLALTNSTVVRILAGTGAASSGQTIYDPAIATTRIDQQQAIFDPTFEMRHDFFRTETPFAIPDPTDPTRGLITGTSTNTYDTAIGLSKRLQNGARADARITVDTNRRQPADSLLNPSSRSSAALSLTQPLLQGAGTDVNRVPIVLARIDAESSFFRLKDGLQETVRGVVQGYWDLVAARTEVWAVDQQMKQAEFALELEAARMRTGSGDQAQLAQAKVALANFRANRVAARSALLEREAALRGVVGLPPNRPEQLVPMSAPITQRLEFDWPALLELAERNRPDLIELKLILEADYQLIMQAKNQTLPQLDAVALYRWNGLEGELPVGGELRSRPGEFTDWQLGVNFSVPLGLRQSRATLRERELLLTRDRANIDQAMLEISHDVAASLRRAEQQFQQYKALQETRLAAIENLRVQQAAFRNGRINFINVLLAITDWGNSVSGEARALAQYNAELATLERATGTILESHGVRFFEERYRTLGPLGICGQSRCYAAATHPSVNTSRYGEAKQPVDEMFRLDAPEELLNRRTRPPRTERDSLERLPPPDPAPN